MRSVSLALVLALPGCFDNVETMFPEGVEPWEDPNEATPPEGTADNPYPEEMVFVEKRWTGGALSMHARAYVQADVQTTFEAVRHPWAGADRRAAVGFTWVDNPEPEYDHNMFEDRWGHRSHLVIPDVVTVEFELTWRSALVATNADGAPTIAATRWQKTWGSTALSVLEGSIVCVEVEPGVTELQIQYHLNALTSSHQTIRDYLTGYYVSILAYAHGEVADPAVRESWPEQL